MKKTLHYIIIFFVTFSYGIATAQCFSSISSGFSHVLAKKTDGTYWAWGYNQGGYFGDGTGTDSYVPIQLPNTVNWQSYKSGLFNSFVIKTNGTLWGTGLNIYGQLGVGSSNNEFLSFVQVGTATTWRAVFPSDSYTIAIKQNGTLWSWGQNVYNQLGQGGVSADITSPLQIGIANDWRTVANCRSSVSFAIKNNGTLWGWGNNIAGLLGDSSISAWTVPTQHNTDNDWDKISMGTSHVLAIKTNGTLWAWGGGDFGQSGQDPSTNYDPSAPFQIAGNWKTATGGERFSIGIKTDGTLWAWGKNDVGQLGDGTTTNTYIPVQLGTASNWDQLSCGDYYTVALRADGSLWTWGNNNHGQLGNGTTDVVTTPTNIPIAGCSLGTETFTTTTHFTISPSPAQQEVLVTYQGAQTVDAIVIYDISGKEVYRIAAMGNAAFSSSFSLATLSAGSYVMVLTNGGKKVASKQFVKE
jgi:alpha-tubulin suppressor-like RCC1 family protein